MNFDSSVSLLLDDQESKRLRFRKILKSDFKTWIEFFKDARTSVHWTEVRGTPHEKTQKWYSKQFNRYENNLGGMNALIEKTSGNLIGPCGLLMQTVNDAEELEIGYSLLPVYWNKGYATEAAQKCRDYAFENNLSEELISIISVTNFSSMRVAIKNGMRLDSQTIYKQNQVNIFRILKEDWESIKN